MVDVAYTTIPAHNITSSTNISPFSSSVARRPPSPSALSVISSHGTATMGDKPSEDISGPQEPSGAQEIKLTEISNTTRVWTGLVAGAVAGAIAKTAIAPLDRTKINFQIHREPYSVRGVVKFLQETIYKEGIVGLWRGNSATMARIVPYGAIQFTSHEQWKRVLGLNVTSPIDHSEDAHIKRFLAGSLAGVTSQSLTYPLDLARARMAVTSKGELNSLRSVFRVMWQQESILAFYRGYLPTLLGVIPYAGLSFFTYDTLKHHYRVWLGDEKPSQLINLACGAIAGAIAQTGSYPLDIVRRRMQTAAVTGEHYDTIIGSLSKIYREEGIRGGFFKGLSMNWVKGPIAVGIGFASNEFVRDHLRRVL
ncbi:mitochondrial coenzyme A transporter SLC25A42 isoform X1 [Frankliniella occidentalis]|uniref:Mitochondrial coenzyme A transporter SLC25A42 isoform X1 n=1 Tax=Frankliniella occidentalis TaxID=133901 RepID=A0A6J1T8T2_FRAOC|nr:mitochondrial coenzyme A transporter SLC25A42 isoform X2 [Frankliniella occidentalis]XP_026289707.1 mitochondrial coenzyme A transporter SLC25A42 isoform X2 [Frankliniella occidentalis]XP_026289708.1 mitochondrial coenzyme A transporter SLC25A42 isoform X2 [Frankliniella occidentalis]XP_026289709.1 mitochondrial coenzyme A transporter SLC25A42 isoform X2 [Frankliniella occidentalis]XP_052124824.1 mitochondrial coenzyme A transporter SLC25A42 isoform X1 [Frankliniella occidentalis]XP_0521248